MNPLQEFSISCVRAGEDLYKIEIQYNRGSETQYVRLHTDEFIAKLYMEDIAKIVNKKIFPHLNVTM